MQNPNSMRAKTNQSSATMKIASSYFTRSNTVILFSFGPYLIIDKIHIEKQTVAYNIKARVDFKSKKRARMSVWEAIEMLNTIIDDSDPDVCL